MDLRRREQNFRTGHGKVALRSHREEPRAGEEQRAQHEEMNRGAANEA